MPLVSAYPADALQLPTPLPQQEPILDSPASRKVVRAGRRFSKSRTAMIAGFAGHGPGAPEDPMFPGVLQGWDVVWVAKDYPQLSTVMWREEFVPRLKHLPFVHMNANEHYVALDGLGTLYLRPETAIGGIRGIGKRLKGVILDEAAWYDLEAALKDVILPALLDNQGWLLLMSTTNAGHDGNAAIRLPSYFNLICEQIAKGERGPEWVEFTGTAFDNPRLSRSAIEELIGEYDEGSVALDQEVYAKLLPPGGGQLALSIPDAVLVQPTPVPRHHRHFAAVDWGYSHPWSFGLFSVNDSGHVRLRDSASNRKQEPPDIATEVKTLLARYGLTFADLDYTIAGGDVFADMGKARGLSGPTISEQWHKAGWNVLESSAAGAGRRVPSLNNMRLYLREAQLSMCDTPSNRRVLACLRTRIVDPKDPEDVLKQDADAKGNGGDDDYDMVRYGLYSRPIIPGLLKAKTDRIENAAPLPKRMVAEPTSGYRAPRRDGLVKA